MHIYATKCTYTRRTADRVPHKKKKGRRKGMDTPWRRSRFHSWESTD